MELPTLSIGIMCKDEERTIEKCLNVIFCLLYTSR
ncbi:hypothetical protein A5885_002241 [Enterococcus sp. 8E11_MSG4843]|nr:hypothetical protein A5885_002241 [Enterococcus sp. 8E11_MSG4843]